MLLNHQLLVHNSFFVECSTTNYYHVSLSQNEGSWEAEKNSWQTLGCNEQHDFSWLRRSKLSPSWPLGASAGHIHWTLLGGLPWFGQMATSKWYQFTSQVQVAKKKKKKNHRNTFWVRNQLIYNDLHLKQKLQNMGRNSKKKPRLSHGCSSSRTQGTTQHAQPFLQVHCATAIHIHTSNRTPTSKNYTDWIWLVVCFGWSS